MTGNEIKIMFGGGQKVDASIKDFFVRTDQPATEGGEGTAPAPFDLFLASIATCAGFYVLAFCRERGIPTTDIGIVMTTEKHPESKMISKISIRIDLPPAFPEKYRGAVARAVDQCTVKAHILKPPVFEIVANPRS